MLPEIRGRFGAMSGVRARAAAPIAFLPFATVGITIAPQAPHHPWGYIRAVNRQFFGWDIGGAHLKIAWVSDAGEIRAVRQIACPLWRGIDELARAAALIDFSFSGSDAVHAVTMTGELCDSFVDRAAGVRAILAAFAGLVASDAEVRVFAGYEGWLDPGRATGAAALAVASANWLALGAFTAELIGDGVLIDVGSTTTDVIPIGHGEVLSRGRDDATRLACHELVYTGVVRTPVFGVCDSVPFRGQAQPLCAEIFATMSDVYRVLGRIGERHDLMPAADGGSKDVEGSARRLSRMLGFDFAPDAMPEWRAVAKVLADRQRRRIEDALALVLSRSPPAARAELLVGAGVGRFVVEEIARVCASRYCSFEALLGVGPEFAEDVAIAAPAVAAAKLAWMTT